MKSVTPDTPGRGAIIPSSPLRHSGPDIAHISLSNGLWATVDAEDYAYLSRFKWCHHQGYAARGIRVGDRIHTVLMHRIIMMTPDGVETDHKNGNGLDNRKKNLRYANGKQNSQNRRRSSNNKSGYKGVCWNSRRGKWEVQIRINGKKKFLGYFNKPEDAARKYNQAAIKYFGEFARINKIKEIIISTE